MKKAPKQMKLFDIDCNHSYLDENFILDDSL